MKTIIKRAILIFILIFLFVARIGLYRYNSLHHNHLIKSQRIAYHHIK